ncbi:MAG: hypothetical protein ACR2PH_16660 [Desulfobulbia bacterium]
MTQKMKGLTRRQTFAGAAALVAAPSILKLAGSKAEAAAPMMGGANPSHYRFKLGTFEITTIFDGFVKVP